MLFLIPIAILALFLIPKADAQETTLGDLPEDDVNPLGDGGEIVMETSPRLYDLKDVNPANQSGDYKTTYDVYFEAAADEFGVPFALMKAQSIKESSLNPKASLDENPSGRADRVGWKSRGLMQLLWADDANNDLVPVNKKLYDRFKKYGYSGNFIAQSGGNILFDPSVNTRIAAQLIRDNLKSCKGNLRDTINMYNAGVKESVRQAPGGYVDKVINYYNIILGE